MSDLLQRITLMIGDYMEACCFEKAIGFLNYLETSGISESQILELYKDGWIYTYQSLPLSLWETSLLKPYTYYYHAKLQQTSKPCTLDSKTGVFTEPVPYKEMRIMLTAEDVILTMYETLNTLPEFQQLKRDVESLKHILIKHPIVFIGTTRIETLDVILMMFDQATGRSMAPMASFFDIYNLFYKECLLILEEMLITPQKSFTLRTGELVVCHGK